MIAVWVTYISIAKDRYPVPYLITPVPFVIGHGKNLEDLKAAND